MILLLGSTGGPRIEGQTMTTVRVSITSVDLACPTRPGQLLLDVDDHAPAVGQVVRRWARARGYDEFVPFVTRVLNASPRPEGALAVVSP